VKSCANFGNKRLDFILNLQNRAEQQPQSLFSAQLYAFWVFIDALKRKKNMK